MSDQQLTNSIPNLYNSVFFNENNNQFLFFSSDATQKTPLKAYNKTINLKNTSLQELFPVAMISIRKIGEIDNERKVFIDKLYEDSLFYYITKDLPSSPEKKKDALKKKLDELELDKDKKQSENKSENQAAILEKKISGIDDIDLLTKLFIFIVDLIDFIAIRDIKYEKLESIGIVSKYLLFFKNNQKILSAYHTNTFLDKYHSLDISSKKINDKKGLLAYSQMSHQLLRYLVLENGFDFKHLQNTKIEGKISGILYNQLKSISVQQRFSSLKN